jgi:hypothetical protein
MRCTFDPEVHTCLSFHSSCAYSYRRQQLYHIPGNKGYKQHFQATEMAVKAFFLACMAIAVMLAAGASYSTK